MSMPPQESDQRLKDDRCRRRCVRSAACTEPVDLDGRALPAPNALERPQTVYAVQKELLQNVAGAAGVFDHGAHWRRWRSLQDQSTAVHEGPQHHLVFDAGKSANLLFVRLRTDKNVLRSAWIFWR
jgi:hypothetical protein